LNENEQTVFAVQYALLVISEAAMRRGEQAHQLASEQPWRRSIGGLGNWLRHGYDRIDPGILRQTVIDDLPLLKAAAKEAMRSPVSGRTGVGLRTLTHGNLRNLSPRSAGPPPRSTEEGLSDPSAAPPPCDSHGHSVGAGTWRGRVGRQDHGPFGANVHACRLTL
jgi:uncharacterized protein with HEPN domain